MTVKTAMTAADSEHIARRPWVHNLSISVNGNVTALSAPSGDMGSLVGGKWSADGAQGVYVDDRRAVSELAVHLGNESPVPVADASSGGRSDFFSSARQLGNPGADPTVEVRRRRTVIVQGITEILDIASRADQCVETDVVLHIAGDGAAISSVKSGIVTEALLAAARLEPSGSLDTGLSWRDQWHRTDVTFDPAPTSLILGGPGEVSVATFRLVVAPGQTRSVVATVRASRLQKSSFDADSGAPGVDWSEVFIQSVDRRLEPILVTGLNDLQHLLLTDPEEPSSVFAAAGTPWYLTLFGRDALWASRMTLPFGTELAAGTLRALARRQGSVLDSDRAEAPGKIPHELRRTSYGDPSAGLDLPPVYYGTIDATPLWISLLRDAWKWGLPDRRVEALLPNLQAATRWLTEFAAPDPDGLLKYIDASGKGLANQGWKDSGDAIRWRDGHVADAPIALCEAQAYAIEAASAAAELFNHFNIDGSADLNDYAEQMRARFRDHFWVGPQDGRRYIGLAVDGHGQTVDGLGSNMGHVLGTGTLNAEEVERVAHTLTSPELLSRYGICTLASDNVGFNPIGYHTGSIWTHDTAICAWGLAREGKRDEATRLAQSLLASAEAFAAVLIWVALGFEPDAPAGRLTLRPARPASYGQMTVHGLRFAGRSFGVRCAPDGGSELLDAPDDIEIVIL